MSKYDEAFKRSMVEQYLAGPDGYKNLGHRHRVHPSAIRKWVALYRLHGDAGLQKKHTYYSAEFKLSVLTHMHKHGLSYTQTAAVFNIRSMGNIGIWERQYDNGGFPARPVRPRRRPKPMPDKPKDAPQLPAGETRTLKEVLAENEYLRMENAYLKKLDALIQEKKLAAQKKRK
jgi:transposase